MAREVGEQYLDLEFPPREESVNGETQDGVAIADRVIHWRRPHEFVIDAENEEPVVFARPEIRDPSQDIVQGQIPNTWLFSTISTVAQLPSLIERVFINQEYNYEGVHKIKLCLGGEWEEILIDDIIPCYPLGGPIFSHNNLKHELWLPLLEKAFAKVHGSYRGLLTGFIPDALLNLTGFPTISMTLRDENIYDMLESGVLWETLKLYHSQGYILAGCYDSEIETEHDDALVPPHEAFAIIDIDENS